MPSTCPWCKQTLGSALLRNLGAIAQPCPHCARPIRASTWQILFIALAMAPLAASILWLARIAYENGSKVAATIIVIAGIVFAIFLQRYVPTVHGPARGAGAARIPPRD